MRYGNAEEAYDLAPIHHHIVRKTPLCRWLHNQAHEGWKHVVELGRVLHPGAPLELWLSQKSQSARDKKLQTQTCADAQSRHGRHNFASSAFLFAYILRPRGFGMPILGRRFEVKSERHAAAAKTPSAQKRRAYRALEGLLSMSLDEQPVPFAEKMGQNVLVGESRYETRSRFVPTSQPR